MLEKITMNADVDDLAAVDAEVADHKEETRSSFIRDAIREKLARRKEEKEA